MKEGQRNSPTVSVLFADTPPPPEVKGALEVARRRTGDLLRHGRRFASLDDLLAACYLLGIEDIAEAQEKGGEG
ncbi:MAG TPA: hypothetical protein VJ725_21505 [Thermoanaerobaculia bacterium]|nr:hypothetical protein [Thermoanaerobaculia bacterium]